MNQSYFLYGNQILELEEKTKAIIESIQKEGDDPVSVLRFNSNDFTKDDPHKANSLIVDLKNTCETVSFFPVKNIIVIKDIQDMVSRKSPQQALEKQLSDIRLIRTQKEDQFYWIDQDSLTDRVDTHQQITAKQIVEEIYPLEGSLTYLKLVSTWEKRMIYIQKQNEMEAIEVEDFLIKKVKKNLVFHIPKNHPPLEKAKDSTFTELIKQYLVSPPEQVFIILTANIKSPKEINQSLYQLIQKHAQEIKTLVSNDNFKPVPWVIERAKEKKLNFDRTSAEVLIELAGSDLFILNEEINKLSILLPDDQAVTPELLLDSTSHSKRFSIFRIAEFLTQRDLKNTLEYLEEMLGHHILDPLPIFGMISSQFRKLLKIACLLNGGHLEKDILNRLKLNHYFGKIAIGQARTFSLKELENIVVQITRQDLMIKYHSKDALIILENLCFQICQGNLGKQNFLKRHWLPEI
ncbi:MAG: DNA polymerase III subunit delta [Deltaproteobacteria bacterium]|nr:DNA polymerase III subunit delta [Deltaproteobacteria bacterium]